MLFFLVAGHALMDFALQPDAMAVCKCRRANHPLQKSVPWYYWLTAHCLQHGGMVGAVVAWFGYAAPTAVLYGVLETGVHWVIDLAKCEGYTNIHVDQGLHVGCKVLWVTMLLFGVTA